MPPREHFRCRRTRYVLRSPSHDSILQHFQVLTHNEALSLHAEVLALQRTLGISYKEAAHRLYMSELERLKAERRTEQAMRGLREHVDKTLFHEIYPPLDEIDSGRLDKTQTDMTGSSDKATEE